MNMKLVRICSNRDCPFYCPLSPCKGKPVCGNPRNETERCTRSELIPDWCPLPDYGEEKDGTGMDGKEDKESQIDPD